jgi:acetyl-CoA carboxylase carboxyl transferase subunit alpha
MPEDDKPDEEQSPVEQKLEANPSWQRVQVARHPKRPHSNDYVRALFTDFEELQGFRLLGDDK